MSPAPVPSPHPRSRGSLRARIAVVVGLVVALSALVTAGSSWIFVRDLLVDRARSQLDAEALARARAIESFATTRREWIASLGGDTELRQLVRGRIEGHLDEVTFRQRSRAWMRDQRRHGPDVRSIHVLDARGRVLAEIGGAPLRGGLPQEAVFGRGAQEPHVRLFDESAELTTAMAPIARVGQAPLGVVLAKLDTSALRDRLALRAEGYGSFTVDVRSRDPAAAALHFVDGRAAEPPSVAPPAMDAALGGAGGVLRAQSADGRDRVVAHQPVAGLPWGTVVSVDVEDACAPLDRLAGLLVGSTAIVVALSALLASLLATRITRPIVGLAGAARAFEGGDRAARAPVGSSDEVGAVADAFNSMADALAAHHGDLEERVRSRTEALEHEIAQRDAARKAIEASERRFSAVAETAHDAIISADAEGRITYLNPAAQRVFGWSDDDARGEPLTILMPLRFQDAHRDAFARYVATRTPHIIGRTVHLEGQRRSGEVFPAELSIATWDDTDGRPAFTSILRDITARRQADAALERSREELAQAKEAAEQASRAKSEFLANMSHEIRTPMNGIIGMTELLLTLPLDAQQRDFVTTIARSADTLLRLLNDILDLSRIEAGRLETEAVRFSLCDALGDTLQALALRASEKGLELVYDIQDDVPDGLVGDPIRLRQIFVNLVGNAVKFTDHGEVLVRVELVRREGDDVVLRCEVTDTGPGISAEVQGRIFRAFEQADASVSRTHGGTGLGLAIASRLVELMGGRIGLTSAPGQGSTFHFTARFGVHDVAPARTPAILSGLRVLLVDDNETNRRVLSGLLTSWRMNAASAASGAEALDELRRASAAGEPFAVALLDSMMPGMDGLELAARIRDDADLSDLVLLMLSSAGRARESERAKDLGIARHLVKPVKQSDLLAALQQALGEDVVYREAVEHEDDDDEAPRGLYILVAEDDLVNQRVATRLLEQRDHVVEIARNGREAVEAVERGRFDLVLMDVRMPEMGGLEATRMIRERERARGGHVPIVAMTAHAMRGDAERCLAAGMDDYVSKPVHARDLHAAVKRAVAPRQHSEAGRDPSWRATSS